LPGTFTPTSALANTLHRLASLPLDTNARFMTVMANKIPVVGRD
jgi:hypothetical protein